MPSGGEFLLTEPEQQAALAYERWASAVGPLRNWRFKKPGDWMPAFVPFADALVENHYVGSMLPLKLVGSTQVYRTQDGSNPLRDDYAFAVGGSQQIGGCSIFFARWRGVFNKRIDDVIFVPAEMAELFGGAPFDAWYPEVLSDNGNTSSHIQLVRNGLPALRFGWWGRDRQRATLINMADAFMEAMAS